MRIQVNPCNNFCDDKYTIDPRFITELKKLVDIAIEGDMYVIIDGFFWPLQLDPKWRQDIVKYEGVLVNEEYKEPAKKILKAFTNDGINSVDNLMLKSKMKKNIFSVYRDRLIKRGIIESPEYGKLSLKLPRFYEFLERQI